MDSKKIKHFFGSGAMEQEPNLLITALATQNNFGIRLHPVRTHFAPILTQLAQCVHSWSLLQGRRLSLSELCGDTWNETK